MSERSDTMRRAGVLATDHRVDMFAKTHFGLGGTLRLHRAAIGWDILRAPVNVALAPMFLLVGLAGIAVRMVRLHRLANWLQAHRVLLRTSVARVVESLIATELLGSAQLTPHGRKLIRDYVGVRSAVAEITTSLVVLTVGMIIFGAATPGLASLAPKVSEHVAHSTAVEGFWLGSRLGARWYGMFPVAIPVWSIIAMFMVLAMAASILTTFAGLVADPIQTGLGIHQRRLRRLLDRIGAAEESASGLEPEHFLARLADLGDVWVSLLRLFRS